MDERLKFEEVNQFEHLGLLLTNVMEEEKYNNLIRTNQLSDYSKLHIISLAINHLNNSLQIRRLNKDND